MRGGGGPGGSGRMSDGWESTADAEEVAGLLRGSGSVLILTHTKADGDAVGSAVSVSRALGRVGVESLCVFTGPTPRWVGELAGKTAHRVFEGTVEDDGVLGFAERSGAICVVDTGSWSQLEDVRGVLEGRGEKTVVVDHHAHGDPGVGRVRLIDTGCASATSVLTPVCCALMECSASGLPADVAEALYLGLATDTGWFRHSNAGADAMRLAGDLVESGADKSKLYRMVEQRDRASRYLLMGRALVSMELFHGGRVAVMRLTADDFAASGADRTETGGFADMALGIESVEVSVVLTEQVGDGVLTKVSARSKPASVSGGRFVDVNALCQQFGGGGHVHAAGAKVVGGLEAVRDLVVEGAIGQLA